MPFEVQHTPLSALLGLGSIAGNGIGIAQRKADRLREAMQAAQLVSQQINQQQQNQQQQNQLQAQTESNRISQSLAYDRLAQEQQQQQAQQAQHDNEFAARQKLSQEQGQQAQDTRNQQLQLNQQKFETTQNNADTKDTEVDSMIDKLYPPGTPENDHLKLQYHASGHIPAPQAESQARNLNALVIARKTLVDPIGEAQPGKEAQLAQIDQQIAAITNGISGTKPAAPQAAQQSQPAVTAVNPQTGQRIQYDPATQQWLPIH